MWPIIAYGGLAFLSVVVEVLYVIRPCVEWYSPYITGLFMMLFGWQAWKAYQEYHDAQDFVWINRCMAEHQRYVEEGTQPTYRYSLLSDGTHGWIRVLGIVLVCLGLLVAPAAAMTCTTHTYSVDGRYVMCQTCCTNGMCQTTCL